MRMRNILFSILIIVIIFSLDSFLSKEVEAQQPRPLKYYGVDTANPGDFATLAQHNINTVSIYLAVGGSEAGWQEYFTAAENYNMNIMVWPGGGSGVCSFPYKGNGGDISEAHRLLDFLGQQEKFVAIHNAHEPFWSCKMSIDFMKNSKTAIKDYIRQRYNREIEVFNYIDNVEAEIPSQYYNRDDIGGIMDIAGTYQHTFNGASSSQQEAVNRINADRALINRVGLDGEVDLAFAFQTFGSIAWGKRMPSGDEIREWGCKTLQTNALDVFIWYAWRNPSNYEDLLGDRPDLWDDIDYVYDNCVNQPTVTPTPTKPPTPTQDKWIPY